jgi:hypothetical protein
VRRTFVLQSLVAVPGLSALKPDGRLLCIRLVRRMLGARSRGTADPGTTSTWPCIFLEEAGCCVVPGNGFLHHRSFRVSYASRRWTSRRVACCIRLRLPSPRTNRKHVAARDASYPAPHLETRKTDPRDGGAQSVSAIPRRRRASTQSGRRGFELSALTDWRTWSLISMSDHLAMVRAMGRGAICQSSPNRRLWKRRQRHARVSRYGEREPRGS